MNVGSSQQPSLAAAPYRCSQDGEDKTLRPCKGAEMQAGGEDVPLALQGALPKG